MSFYDPLSTDEDEEFQAKAPEKPNSAWMLTVADLFSLMLTFFVLLYSMSVITDEDWEVISESLLQQLKVTKEPVDFQIPEVFTIQQVDLPTAKDLDYLKKVIDDKLTSINNPKGIVVRRGLDHISISLTSDEMFDAGKGFLNPKAKAIVQQLGEFLANIGNEVKIEGHTDPAPIYNNAYPSNWELSTARAVSVANALREVGYPYNLDVFGLGSSRFASAPPAATQKERYANARRVDIIVRESVAKF